MKTQALQFNSIVETVYSLPLEDRLELKRLLEHNFADTRREEIANNFKIANVEYKSGGVKFSTKINELKKML